MGANEDEFERIRANGPFGAPEHAALRNSMAALALTIKEIAGSPGWEGLSASAASAHLEELSRRYLEIEAAIGDVQTEIDNANRIRTAALTDYDALPSAQAPSWVHDTLDAFDFPGIPQPVDLAQGGLALIEGFLGDQRDQAAGRILAAYREALGNPAVRTDAARERIGALGGSIDPNAFQTDDPGDGTSTGSWTNGGAYRGTGYTGVEFRRPDGFPPYRPPGIDDDVEVGVDDPNTGVLPGGGGSGGGGSTGSGGSGGGGIPGGAGIGAGSAIAGAGALAATRFAGGAGARAAGGARLGTGGLLGTGAPASGASGSKGSAARGASAGGRGGSGLLGSSGANGGAGREDRKRKAGRGLGGPIAPKLDDEDDVILPGSGARAGGRDESAPAELDG